MPPDDEYDHGAGAREFRQRAYKRDRDKILATVFAALFKYLENYPDRYVTISGSSPSRTRLYRMAISKYGTELEDYLNIYGFTKGSWEFFRKNVDYSLFLVKRKN